MTNLTNSRSLTDFQRNARSLIDGLNRDHEPLLLTVNGTIQAVLVDPKTYQQMEEEFEKQRLMDAIREGERAIEEGRVRSAEDVFADLEAKYGF